MSDDKIPAAAENTRIECAEPSEKEVHTQATLGKDASAANASEHEETLREAIFAWPGALLWSLVVSMSIIMEGYDTILIQNLFAYPAFKKQFGTDYGGVAGYQIPSEWQAALASGQVAGSVIGAFLNGFFIHRFGYKKVFMVSLVLMNAFIFLPFFGKTLTVQVLGQVFCGIPWGVFATIGPAYASEVCPLRFRGYLTAYSNMCFAIGQFIASGVLQSMSSRTDQWSYRIVFALQWLWPAPLLVVACFMPESPWWLVQNERFEEADKSLQQLMSRHAKVSRQQVLAMIQQTDEFERQTEKGTSYMDCFRGVDRRRTEIACLVFAGQVLSGSNFAYSSSYFFEQAGFSSENAYKLGLGGTAIAFCGTIGAWFIMTWIGRRTIYLIGMASMCTCLLLIGVLASAAPELQEAIWAQGAFALIWLLAFSLSIGPIGWCIPAEVSSTRLRSKTVVLGRNTYYVVNIAANVFQPYMMNPTQLNWKGKTGFFWLGTGTLIFIWAFFRLPETKERTFHELDTMFSEKIPARKFKSHVVGSE